MYYDKITDETSPKVMVEKMEEAFVEGSDWKIEAFKNRIKTIQSNLKNFELDRIKNKLKKPIFLEKTFRAQLFEGLPIFEGIIDAYFPEVEMAVDWKTGEHEEMDTSRMIQGKIYEMLLKANGVTVKKVLFNNLTIGRQLTLPRITDGWISNVVSQMMEMVNSGRFPKKESPLCNGWCGYRLSCDFQGICPWSGV